MITKTELDINVAHELGKSPERVAEITAAFIDAIRDAIVEHGAVQLRGLGRLVAKMEMGNPNISGKEVMRIKLYFSKSGTLKDQIERKYGINKGVNHGKQ